MASVTLQKKFNLFSRPIRLALGFSPEGVVIRSVQFLSCIYTYSNHSMITYLQLLYATLLATCFISSSFCVIFADLQWKKF